MVKRNWERRFCLILFLLALGCVLGTGRILERARLGRLHENTVREEAFRAMELSEEAVLCLGKMKPEDRGRAVGLFLLDRDFCEKEHSFFAERNYMEEDLPLAEKNCERECLFFAEENLRKRENFWRRQEEWREYLAVCEGLWNDVKYFPVPKSVLHESYGVSFVDSWMAERNFGGARGHEGCDIMAEKDVPGLYPVVSMTDGEVIRMGWLPKGGYRIGVRAPSGAYFYYAHLDSYANLREESHVRAGDVLGFMGDTGYGKEGTRGMFPTHLHLGVYLYPGGQETSYNPYWILRMIAEKKLSCSF